MLAAMTETYRIRSPETWLQARDDYLAGLTAEAVCRRHDLGLSAFRSRARKQGWRRTDQGDASSTPPDDDLGLSIYDDVGIDEQIHMARQRFNQALHHGKPMEAARWRRLWRELCDERDALDADLLPHMSPSEIQDMLAAEADADEAEEEFRSLSAALRRTPPASPEPARPENVHDVHPVFSSADSPPGRPSPPLLPRAERRRQQRALRRSGAQTEA